MNAKEARQQADKIAEDERIRQQKAYERAKAEDEAAKNLGAKEASKHLKDIYSQIQNNVKSGELEWRLINKNQSTGRAYLIGVMNSLEEKLTRDGYKVKCSLKTNEGRIFEGYMNPEVVGYEFIDHELRITIVW